MGNTGLFKNEIGSIMGIEKGLINNLLYKEGLLKSTEPYKNSDLYNDPHEDNRKEHRFLSDLLKIIETEDDPDTFKDAMLESIQLYFDGLVENRLVERDPNIWRVQEEILNDFLKGLCLTTSGYYRGNGDIPYDEVRKLVKKHESELTEHGHKGVSKIRNLRNLEDMVEKFAEKTSELIENEEIDLIIPVASGGFELAALISVYLGIRKIRPIRFSRVARWDNQVLSPYHAPISFMREQIEGKRVLIVDDIKTSGITQDRVSSWVKNLNPSKAYFGVVIPYELTSI